MYCNINSLKFKALEHLSLKFTKAVIKFFIKKQVSATI